MLEVTQAEAARLPGIGVSKQRINALVKQGRLPVTKDKKVRVKDVYRVFAKDTDPAWDDQAAARIPAQDAPVTRPDADGGEDDSPSFRDAKTKQALIAIERQQFELDQKKGLYLPRADVERAMDAAGRKLRRLLDGLPMLADELYAAAQGGSAADLKKVLKEKARAIQESLAEAVRLGAHEQDDDAGA